jgi:hypothetical protein
MNLVIVYLQALQMAYFSNKPATTPGPQLPFPKSNKIIDKEREAKKPSLKRKQNGGGDVGKLIYQYDAGIWFL